LSEQLKKLRTSPSKNFKNPNTGSKFTPSRQRKTNSRARTARAKEESLKKRKKTIHRHVTHTFYEEPNNTARRSSRKKYQPSTNEQDSGLAKNRARERMLQDRERPNLNDVNLSKRIHRARTKKHKRLMELRKVSYTFENNLISDGEKVGVKVGLNMLHTDELMDYYKTVVSKGRKDLIAHSKNGGIPEI
jgi:hypothetical protein